MYQPAEDSELLAEAVRQVIKNQKPKNFLDMGCGTGIQSKTALNKGIGKEGILAVDIDDEAIKETKKLGIKVLKSDLFDNVKKKFDLIAFNPPYLPEDNHDKGKDTTGGKEGWEIIERFLQQVKNYLTEKGRVLLLFSSLTNRQKIEEIIKLNGLQAEEIAIKKLFMERLFVFLIKRKKEKKLLLTKGPFSSPMC